MAYWLTDLQKSVLDRLQADTGTGGLLADGAELISSVWATEALPPSSPWWNANGKDPEDPMIVFDLQMIGNDDTQGTSGKIVSLVVSVYVRAEDEEADHDPLNIAGQIIERVEGDWVAQGVGTAPTYGLDRYSSGALTGGYRLNDPGWMLESIQQTSVIEWHEWEISFSASIHKAGA